MFAAAGGLGVPVGWNLAGGYQGSLRKILDVHDNTLRESAARYLVQDDQAVVRAA